MFRLYSLIFFTFFIGILSAQNFNRPIPFSHFPYEFNQTGSNDDNYYLMTPFKIGNNAPSYYKNLSLLDSKGYLFWYSASIQYTFGNFQYHPDHHVFSYIRAVNPIEQTQFMVLDSAFNVIDSIQPTNGVLPDAHDFLILSNGNYVVTGFKDSIMDLSSFQFNNVQGLDTTDVKAAIIQEFDSNHNLIFEWNSLDGIHPTEFIDGYPYNVNSFDYAHINAVEEDSDGNFLVSMRHTDAIYKINKTTGNIMWALGGTSNQFTFTNDNGFSGQHDIRRLSNGNITLFDNANNAMAPKTSRGVEYTLDTMNMTCTRVWESVYSPSFFARAMGNNRLLNNDERIVGYGFVLRPNPNFVHYDVNDNVLSELFFEDSVLVYRSLSAEIPINFNEPIINCFNNAGAAVLVAPSGYSKYEWSTGENTQSIVVSDTGIYQVWVNKGIGMLGSVPFYINNINNPCNPVGIDDIDQVREEKEILYVYDLVGRKINYPKIAQLYVVKYSDGSSELIHWKNILKINE